MSDFADMSDKNVETFLASAIAHARGKQGMKANGHCRFCDELIGHGELFCNIDCRNDYQKLQAAIIRNGGKISY